VKVSNGGEFRFRGGEAAGGFPYNTAENLGRQQRLDILGGKKQRSPCIDKHQGHDSCPAVSKPFRHPAVDDQADKLPNIGTLKRTH
jgi:hypothetical protein